MTTTEELLKRATPLKDWKFEKCPCGSPVCNKFLLNIARSSRMFDPEHAELIRRMAASWEAMREALEQCDKAFACWQVGQIPGRPEEILALIVDLRRALALSNGKEPTQ